jgi:hypothetical protein
MNILKLKREVAEAQKRPLKRKEIIKLILSYSGDEFENKGDMVSLAEKETDVLADSLTDIVNYFENNFENKDITNVDVMHVANSLNIPLGFLDAINIVKQYNDLVNDRLNDTWSEIVEELLYANNK